MPNRQTAYPLGTVLWLVLALACAVSLAAAIADAQECINNRTFKVCSKPKGNDNKRHITVSFNGGSGAEQSAIQLAIDEWNRYSDITGIVFEPAPEGSTADLEFTYSTSGSDTGGCAAFRPSTSTIYWGQEWRSRLTDLGREEAAAVIMHELGHLLGLNENNTEFAQIMHQGDCNLTTGATGGANNVSIIEARRVAECLASHCTAPPRTTSRRGYSETGPTCRTEHVINPTYDNEGVTGYETESVTMCN